MNNKINRDTVYLAIDSERNYQDKKWKHMKDEDNSLSDWVLYMKINLSKCENAIYDSNNYEDFKEHMRKVIALGVACSENIGINNRKI